jgi:hypothetical protein
MKGFHEQNPWILDPLPSCSDCSQHSVSTGCRRHARPMLDGVSEVAFRRFFNDLRFAQSSLDASVRRYGLRCTRWSNNGQNTISVIQAPVRQSLGPISRRTGDAGTFEGAALRCRSVVVAHDGGRHRGHVLSQGLLNQPMLLDRIASEFCALFMAVLVGRGAGSRGSNRLPDTTPRGACGTLFAHPTQCEEGRARSARRVRKNRVNRRPPNENESPMRSTTSNGSSDPSNLPHDARLAPNDALRSTSAE